MLWAAFTMAFYGFLRVSEYVNLQWRDVTVSNDHISIRLHQSKTAPFRQVEPSRLAASHLWYCLPMDRRAIYGNVDTKTQLYNTKSLVNRTKNNR